MLGLTVVNINISPNAATLVITYMRESTSDSFTRIQRLTETVHYLRSRKQCAACQSRGHRCRQTRIIQRGGTLKVKCAGRLLRGLGGLQVSGWRGKGLKHTDCSHSLPITPRPSLSTLAFLSSVHTAVVTCSS